MNAFESKEKQKSNCGPQAWPLTSLRRSANEKQGNGAMNTTTTHGSLLLLAVMLMIAIWPAFSHAYTIEPIKRTSGFVINPVSCDSSFVVHFFPRFWQHRQEEVLELDNLSFQLLDGYPSFDKRQLMNHMIARVMKRNRGLDSSSNTTYSLDIYIT